MPSWQVQTDKPAAYRKKYQIFILMIFVLF